MGPRYCFTNSVGPVFVKPEGSQFGGVLFCQLRGVLRNFICFVRNCRDPNTYVDESKRKSE